MHRSLSERLRLGILLALCLAMYLPGLARIPPVDRDEPRFTQATRQMLESGDYLQIRFQHQSRYGKPPGIYWLQALAVKLYGGPPAPLWAYRLPSLLGALIAVLLTYRLGREFFDPGAALLGAAALAATFQLVLEAHQAKTDAVQLAFVVAAQAALARAYLAARRGTATGAANAAVFWLALAGGILVKGPIAPMVSGTTILALGLLDRRWRWLGLLRPRWGILLLLLAAGGPMLAVELASRGQFLARAVNGDLLPKMLGGVESHGAPPGYYLLLSPLILWPASLALPAGLGGALRRWREPAERFCLAWAVPTWAVFEAIPTKLPHYVLVALPPLALLIGAHAGARFASRSGRWLGRLWWVFWAMLGPALAAAAVFAALHFGGALDASTLAVAAVLALLPPIAAALAWRARPVHALRLAIGASLAAYLVLGLWLLPSLRALDVSQRVVAAARRVSGETAAPRIASAGYAEPSLVFLAGTDTLLTQGAGAADFLAHHPHALAVVAHPDLRAFEARAAAAHLTVCPRATVRGVDYARARAVSLTLFTRAPRRADCEPSR